MIVRLGLNDWDKVESIGIYNVSGLEELVLHKIYVQLIIRRRGEYI